MADRHWHEIILITALLASCALLAFCNCYLLMHFVRPVAKIRAHLKKIAEGDLARELEEPGRN
ncbi:MAG: hypothetical protein QM578_23825 [Pantoea sp.]|uniref:hypothetical protein n=1 Tax=Pantoea sp. TaxID=69393 RepID=UPI0039E64784